MILLAYMDSISATILMISRLRITKETSDSSLRSRLRYVRHRRKEEIIYLCTIQKRKTGTKNPDMI